MKHKNNYHDDLNKYEYLEIPRKSRNAFDNLMEIYSK